MIDDRKTHWATRPPSELADKFPELINKFTDFGLQYHMFERWRRMHRMCSGFDPDNDGLTWAPVLSGSQGQIVRTRINAILRYQRAHHVLVIGQRPAPQARPSAYDSRATEAIPVANALLDNAIGKLGGEKALHKANWYAQNYGAGWVSTLWNEKAGRVVNGQPEGDMAYEAHRPDCVVFDTSLDEYTPHKWLILARQVDRYELAVQVRELMESEPIQEADEQVAERRARYVEDMVDHVLRAASNTRLDQQRYVTFRSQGFQGDTSADDNVWVYELFYKPSEAVPEGRYAMWLDGKIIKDGPNPYSDIPVYEHAAMRVAGTRWGYTHFFDLIGPQQIADAHITSSTTVSENVGMNGIWVQPGTDNGEAVSIVNGVRIFNSMTPPQAVEFSGDAPAKLTQAHAYMLEQMTMLSGLNDTALGDTSSANSGKQAALNHALALQSASDYQASYVQLNENVFNGTLNRYRAFATTERVVSIAGAGNEWNAKSFTSDDLKGIEGIDVEMGAAILRTTAGVVDVADKLLQAQVIDGQQYLKFLSTKRLDPVFDGVTRHETLMQRENEMLSSGEEPTVARTDNHPEHMARHRTVLDNPEVRNNPQIANALVNHLMTHDAEWLAITTEQPSLAMALGIPMHPALAAQQAAMQAQQQAPQDNPGGSMPEAPASPQDEAQRTINEGAGGGVDAGGDLPMPAESEVMA